MSMIVPVAVETGKKIKKISTWDPPRAAKENGLDFLIQI